MTYRCGNHTDMKQLISNEHSFEPVLHGSLWLVAKD